MGEERRRRLRRLPQANRLRGGGVVVTEYDASGRRIRETYYTADRAWVTRIVECGESEQANER
jgi:hypothetical protein